MATFHCSKWGSCGCPTGTVRADCPGLLDKRNVHVFEGVNLARQKALDGDCRFPFTPGESLLSVASMLAAFAAVVAVL